MDENLSILPVWKKNATAEERLLELAVMARKNPEKWEKFAIVYSGRGADGSVNVNDMNCNCGLLETMGLFEVGKLRVFERSTGDE